LLAVRGRRWAGERAWVAAWICNASRRVTVKVTAGLEGFVKVSISIVLNLY